MAKGCVVCNGPAEKETEDYCSTHKRAFANINKASEMWQKAYEGLTRKRYLEKLSKLSETGEKVRELADFLVRHPERWDRSEP